MFINMHTFTKVRDEELPWVIVLLPVLCADCARALLAAAAKADSKERAQSEHQAQGHTHTANSKDINGCTPSALTPMNPDAKHNA